VLNQLVVARLAKGHRRELRRHGRAADGGGVQRAAYPQREKDKGGARENQKLTGNAMNCSVKMGKVRIADELDGKLWPSVKGNSSLAAIKYK
jgi:hypothetical protein